MMAATNANLEIQLQSDALSTIYMLLRAVQKWSDLDLTTLHDCTTLDNLIRYK